MSTNDYFKYDVRVRERMLARGMLTDGELKSHLEALKDLESEVRPVSVPQPALATASTGEDEAPESTERP